MDEFNKFLSKSMKEIYNNVQINIDDSVKLFKRVLVKIKKIGNNKPKIFLDNKEEYNDR